MNEVWFFLIRTNTGYVKPSSWYDSFEEADIARRKWDTTYETIITPVMKGYVKEAKA